MTRPRTYLYSDPVPGRTCSYCGRYTEQDPCYWCLRKEVLALRGEVAALREALEEEEGADRLRPLLARLSALEEAVRFALPRIERHAEYEFYGHPCVADPREFRPDPEWSTEEEMTAWREACALAEAGLWDGYYTRGIGTYREVNEELCEARDRLRAALAFGIARE